MKYFAYGEKMFSPQMHEIVGSVRCLGVAKIIGYKLYFHNRSNDDSSGKCNIVSVKDPSCEVFGVLYEISPDDCCLLDKAECLGYGNQEITIKVYPVHNGGTAEVFAITYVAHKDNVFEDLVPFTWYKDLVVNGAKEHHLPADYIHHLEQYASTQDPNILRSTKQKRYLESLFS